jgi:hypothetical protein
MKFAYADPPYVGAGKRNRYKEHPEAKIWDSRDAHVDLIKKLTDDYPDGWAYSCNTIDLRWVLPVCPDDVRVAAWVKTFHQIRRVGVQYAWEPVIFRGGRSDPKRVPMIRDWLSCRTAFRKGTIGAKPHEFNVWVLEMLGFDPNLDTVDDLFPGSGGMSAATDIWQQALPISSFGGG